MSRYRMDNKMTSIRGAALVEMSCALCVMLPIVITILLFTVGTCQTLFAKASLQHCASTAARQLSVAYGRDPDIKTSRSAQDLAILSHIRMPPVVCETEQFDDPVFDLESAFNTVKVTVRYPAAGKQSWILSFPFLDAAPLRATATYTLH